jgi:hypothetical protein
VITYRPEVLALASRYFVCLVVADGTTETTEEIGSWARRALRQGLVYACMWGAGSEVIHDAIDSQFIALPDHEARPVVMTTSHPEALEEAADFFMVSALPAAGYRHECTSWLVVEVGQSGALSGARELISGRLKG